MLRAVKTEFDTFERALNATQTRLEQASKELDKLVGVRTRQIRRKLKDVEKLDSAAVSEVLGLEEPVYEEELPPALPEEE